MACYGKILILFLSCFLLSISAIAQEKPPPFDVEKARAASQISDPEQATRAYLDSVPVERRQKTKSYAHGNYVLDVVDFVYSSLILIGLLALGVSAKMRDVARQITRFRPLLQSSIGTLPHSERHGMEEKKGSAGVPPA